MAFAQINVKELSPRADGSPIPTTTVFSFRLKPYNGETVDISTLSVEVRMQGSQGSRTLTLTEADTDEITTTAVGDSYQVTVDIDPDGSSNFETGESVRLQINVSNGSAIAMRQFNADYQVVDGAQLDALRAVTSDLTEVTVNQEQGRIDYSGNVVKFTWDQWVSSYTPEIYKNDVLINSGYTIDYVNGELTFATALSTGRNYVDSDDSDLTEAADRINVTYKHSHFSEQELITFMQIALSEFNGSWPISNHNLFTTQPSARAATILGGAYYLYLAVLSGFINQQIRVKWGEDEWQNLVSVAEKAKENVKERFESLKEAKKHTLASPTGIVVPEFTLPGGRSRYFSFVFGSGV